MTTLDTKTIIVNLLKEDKKTYLSVSRLQKLLVYIYDELSKADALDNYITYFDINFDAIERTVLYNNNIFELDIDGETIYLRKNNTMDFLAQKYQIDNTVRKIINQFINSTAA